MADSEDVNSIPFDLTDTDRANLTAGDKKFVPHSWEDLKVIIAENNLSILKRKPSDLRRYIVWTNETKPIFGSMTSFVCKERLNWTPLASSNEASGPIFVCEDERPFASPNDYKILLNDWPYGISPNIAHIVVWLKTRIPVQQPEGHLTPESSELIQVFVQKTFIDPLVKVGQGQDQVQWFKNWTGLQSVRGLEHFHVLVRDVPKKLLEEWVEGNAPGVVERSHNEPTK